ncbi:ATP-binding protein [Spongiactinospora sp. TRM90649]|uniref:ATP-binding protein n=1 Tax=Spongiactinospora sp. TRM90649 TaxID=3031114 RepID=UPI0023F74F89|nr:ATP-binding protein [Spongiactinospora sp. TRM90649]MDF5754477.1 ATP-binding protein [Spongiactinospora sp. TRM90649]
MTTPVARRQAATGDPPPPWLLTALVNDGNAKMPGFDMCNPASPAIAREFTVSVLNGWGTEDSFYDAQLVISELVTNAMRHAGGIVGLRLIRSGGQLGCAVSDSSDVAPTLTEQDCFAETGRGLHLVEALASSWGWIRLDDHHGKLVWAILTPEC